MSVLSDITIRNHVPPLVDPLRKRQVQPASVDLLLGSDFRIFDHADLRYVDLSDPSTYAEITRLVVVPEDESFVLHSGEFVLANTQETVTIPRSVMARVEGKSSLGRLGLIVHATAGFIDPGFSGTITLEMTNLLRVPILLRPGLPICQVSFSRMDRPVHSPYKGRYQHQKDVTASRYSQ